MKRRRTPTTNRSPQASVPPQSAARETPDIETSSDAYARRFSGPAGAYMLAVQAAAVRDLLPPGRSGSLLDVGGGHAQLAGRAAGLGWRVTVLGSNASCGARLVADPEAASVVFETGDLLNLPFDSSSFDVVVSVRLISHMQDWTGLVRELCRVARTSVLIDYPSLASLNCLSGLAFHAKRAVEANTTRRFRSFWPSEIDAAFAAQGFRRAATRGQFAAPMAVHRMLGSARWLQQAEDVIRRSGLTNRVGNPLIVRFDRAG